MVDVTIYALLDPTTGEPRYVGLTRDLKKRMGRYSRPHTKHLSNWFRSIKAKGLSPLVRVICVVGETIADAVERRWIRRMRERGFRLLNFTEGGERNYCLSEETKAKLSEIVKQRWALRREELIQKTQTPEARAKRNAKNRGRVASPGSGDRCKQWNASRAGIPLSDEHKKKVSESLKSRKFSSETRKKLSEAMKLRWQNHSDEEKLKQIERLSKTFLTGDKEFCSRAGKAAAIARKRRPAEGG